MAVAVATGVLDGARVGTSVFVGADIEFVAVKASVAVSAGCEVLVGAAPAEGTSVDVGVAFTGSVEESVGTAVGLLGAPGGFLDP